MNLALIGYRGTGKTTVARHLAERLGWEWFDADEWLERQAGESIRTIFARDGEQAFRDLESAVIEQLCSGDRRVIACGGGAVLREQNRSRLAAAGKVVWLKASADTLFRRIHSDPSTAERRPDLTASGGYEEIEALLARRTPLYQGCADLEIDTDSKTPEQIADEIVSLLDRD